MEPPKNPIMKLPETAFMLFLSAYLVRWGIRILAEIWPQLFIIAAVILVCILLWRIYLYFHNLGKW